MESQSDSLQVGYAGRPEDACNTLNWNAIIFFAQALQRDEKFRLRTDDPICPQPALHLAARHGQEVCVSVLLANGANSWVRDAFGDTALHLAASHGAIGCVRLLLQAGGDSLGRARNFYGEDPLFKAVAFGRENVVAELVAHTRTLGINSDLSEALPSGEDILDEAIDMSRSAAVVCRVDNPRLLRIHMQGLLERPGRRRLAFTLSKG